MAGLPPVESSQTLLPMAAAADPAAYDLRPEAVARTGARILRLMAGAATGEEEAGLAETLRRGWCPGEAGGDPAPGAALLLCAQPDVLVSTLLPPGRASPGGTPFAVGGLRKRVRRE